MSNIFNAHPEAIFASWIKNIKRKNEYMTTPISLQVSAKLIVFAWTYATYQAHELKDRIGNLNIVDATEQVFVNKLAQIALALQHGFSDDDILEGKTFVHLDPSSEDERYCVNMFGYINGKQLAISGTKKFLYPVVHKNNVSGQLFVYIDAVRMQSIHKTISRLNIVNGSIKVTILGYATKTDVRQNQEQEMMLEYTNRYTAFTGFHLLRPITEITYAPRQYNVPKYVQELQCYENINEKLTSIVTYIKNATDVSPIVQINYSALFDPIIKNDKRV